MNHMLDVRGLEPPEPFERAMEALADLPAGDTLTLVLDRVPYPLLRILERDGHGFEWHDDGQGRVAVRIASAGADLPAGG
ncbi:MAG: DUF2249 domain-containing protein [Pseudazoarcus pumilus]|nr:DUF2249 domain-containing protein [Pseudazoarcus pumilus]